MEPLAALTARKITPEEHKPFTPATVAIDSPVPTTALPQSPLGFQAAVFNFLLANNQTIGIKTVAQCKNARIDGLLELDDGSVVALEIKYRMNWEKACQACWQVGWYRKHVEPHQQRLSSALVVFEEFSADWARRTKKGLLENGWSYWYSEHHEVDGLRTDLVRLRNNVMESFPMALATAQTGAAQAR